MPSPVQRLMALVPLVLLAVLVVDPGAARAAPGHYQESFDTTVYKDTTYSTAAWDTVLGQLHLPDLPIVQVGQWPFASQWVEVAGRRAFVSDGGSVQILDLADPLAPTVLGTLSWAPLIVTPLCATFDGRRLVVGTEELVSLLPRVVRHRVAFYDVDDPTAPTFLGQVTVSGVPRDLLASGGVVWCALDTGGVQGIDGSDPSAPVAGPVTATSGPARCLASDGNRLFVGMGGGAGVRTFRVGAGMTLSIAGGPSESGYDVPDLAFVGGDLFVATSTDVRRFRTDSLGSLLPPRVFSTVASAQRIFLDGLWMFVAEGDGGLEVFRLDASGDFVPVQQVPSVGGPAVDLDPWGPYLLLADAVTGVRVLRVAYPLAGDDVLPEGSRAIDTFSSASAYHADVDRCGNSVFVVGYDSQFGVGMGMHEYDVSDPNSPSEIGSYPPLPGSSANYSRVAADPGGAWVVDGNWVRRLDRGLGSYSETSSLYFPLPQTVRDVAVDAGRLYVLSDRTLFVYDTSTSPPTLVGSSGFTSPVDLDQIVVRGRLLVLHERGGGLGSRVVDVSDPSALTELTRWPGIVEGLFAMEGNLLVHADRNVVLYELSDPMSPVILAQADYLDWTAAPTGVVVNGDRIYVTDIEGVLTVFQWQNSPTLAKLASYVPGPSNVHASWGLVRNGDHLWRLGTRPQNSLVYFEVEGLRVQHRLVDQYSTRIVSKPLLVDTRSVRAVRLTATTTGDPAFWLENEFYPGSNPIPLVADGQWQLIDPALNPGSPGGQLRWRVELSSGTGATGATVSDLTLEWLLDEPTIDAWLDVPDDEGGWVRLDWTRSGWDSMGGVSHGPVDHYDVFRRPLGGAIWESVTTKIATASDLYTALVPVVADSILGGGLTPRTEIKVSAVYASDGTGHESAPVRAFGFDDTDPGPATSLQVAYSPWDSGNHLSWGASPAPDIAHYRIWSSTDPAMAGAVLVDSTTALVWDDPLNQQPGIYYAVQAVDDAQRAAPWTLPGAVTDSPVVSGRSRLLPAAPNPFNPTTVIRFELAEATDGVRLEVFDARGRRMRRLVSGHLEAGRHEVVWDGRDDRGSRVGSGVYFVRLRAGEVREAEGVVLVQ